MNFEPRPHNDFPRFIDLYYQSCRAHWPNILAIAGKWNFEDLIPGMSDFDARLIVADGMSVEDWCALSESVGRVHTEMVKRHPQWARLLEHLPGLNLTVSELTDPTFYYPEFQQWTFHEGQGAAMAIIRDYLANKPWSQRDELFHLKKFAAYIGPYDRQIDPPINMGRFESKYPLHSRFMHYFAPPVQSAVSLIERRGVGKLDALRSARHLFPDPDMIELILDSLERHYETPAMYAEPLLTEIERRMEAYLGQVHAALVKHIALIRIEPQDTPAHLRAKLKTIPVDVAERFYAGVKFGRLMKGRLLFYAQNIEWFDSVPLIRIEHRRLAVTMYDTPLRTYGLARFKQELSADRVLDRITGELVSSEDRQRLGEIVAMCNAPLAEGRERQWAEELARIYDSTLRLTEALGADLRLRLEKR